MSGLEVTDGFAGETWAVVEWTFSGVRPDTGYELTFRGASVLEVEDGLISRESDYYDLPELQQQIAPSGRRHTGRDGDTGWRNGGGRERPRCSHGPGLFLPSGVDRGRARSGSTAGGMYAAGGAGGQRRLWTIWIAARR